MIVLDLVIKLAVFVDHISLNVDNFNVKAALELSDYLFHNMSFSLDSNYEGS